MTPYELTIKGHRRGTGSHSKTESAIASVDRPDYLICEIGTCNILIFKDLSRYPFIAMEDTLRKSGLYETAIFRQGEFLHCYLKFLLTTKV